MSDFAYREKKCLECGKKFIVQSVDDYVYKRWCNGQDRYFCSWSCVRKWDAEREPKTLRRDRIIDGLKDGLSIAEICNRYGVDRSNVVYWRDKLKVQSE